MCPQECARNIRCDSLACAYVDKTIKVHTFFATPITGNNLECAKLVVLRNTNISYNTVKSPVCYIHCRMDDKLKQILICVSFINSLYNRCHRDKI